MKEDKGFEKLKDLFLKKNTNTKKPPTYEWQDLALRVIAELGIPRPKRNSVFNVCKKFPKVYIEKCLNDTKELCLTGECWRYFFKLTSGSKSKNIRENP